MAICYLFKRYTITPFAVGKKGLILCVVLTLENNLIQNAIIFLKRLKVKFIHKWILTSIFEQQNGAEITVGHDKLTYCSRYQP